MEATGNFNVGSIDDSNGASNATYQEEKRVHSGPKRKNYDGKNDQRNGGKLRRNRYNGSNPFDKKYQTSSTEGKRNRRQDSSVCYNCRKPGHNMSRCPDMKAERGKGNNNICFKCGSKDHRLSQCPDKSSASLPFARCFICNEIGHLSSACEKNEKGLYPNGGGCRFCGSKTHFISDCDVKKGKKSTSSDNQNEIVLGKINMYQGGDDDDLSLSIQEQELPRSNPSTRQYMQKTQSKPFKPKVVVFNPGR